MSLYHRNVHIQVLNRKVDELERNKRRKSFFFFVVVALFKLIEKTDRIFQYYHGVLHN